MLKKLIAGLLCAWLSVSIQAEEMVAVGGVDHTGLTVSDLEGSTRFFEVLGFKKVGGDPSYPSHFMSNGQAFITLWRVTDVNNYVSFDRKNHVGLHHLALSVGSFEDLDQLHEILSAFPGVEIEFSPELSGRGPAKHMMLREPSGNRIELVHRP